MRRTEMLRKESSYLVAAIAILILCLCMILDLGRGQNFSSFQVTLPDEDSYFSGTDGATMTAMRWLQGRSDSVVDICQLPRRLQDWATDRRDAILALETLNDMDVIEVTQADGTFVVSPGRLNRGPRLDLDQRVHPSGMAILSCAIYRFLSGGDHCCACCDSIGALVVVAHQRGLNMTIGFKQSLIDMPLYYANEAGR